MNNSLYPIVWNESNFPEMDWHDNKLYGIAFGFNSNELRFDIDYILKWLNPKPQEKYFSFLVVPATLVFHNVYNLQLDFELLDVVIERITKQNPVPIKNIAEFGERDEFDWAIETNNGDIFFKSIGYTQYARKEPSTTMTQSLNLNERGGICFDINH